MPKTISSYKLELIGYLPCDYITKRNISSNTVHQFAVREFAKGTSSYVAALLFKDTY